MRSYSTLPVAAFSILSSCLEAPPQTLTFVVPIPSRLARAERELRMTYVPRQAREKKKAIWHFVGLIIATGSSAVVKVGYIERLNYRSLIGLGEPNKVLPLGLPCIQNQISMVTGYGATTWSQGRIISLGKISLETQ